MKKLFLILLVFILFGCEQPLDEIAIREIIEDAISEEEEIPEINLGWIPETLNIYIFPDIEHSDDTWVKHYIAIDSGNYPIVLRGAKLKTEEHNLFFPDDPWHYIGGGI